MTDRLSTQAFLEAVFPDGGNDNSDAATRKAEFSKKVPDGSNIWYRPKYTQSQLAAQARVIQFAVKQRLRKKALKQYDAAAHGKKLFTKSAALPSPGAASVS